jgi:hypothetical protein
MFSGPVRTRRTGMPKKSNRTFGSPEIAREMARMFGDQAKTISVEMKYEKEFGSFVRKIEDAHKQAGKSKLIFG